MANRIQLRRDTAANWSTNNPILDQGEPGFETDSRSIKVGTGTLPWNCLQYTGTIGFQGYQGNQGAQGPQGNQGRQGYQGSTGAQGQGVTGSQGAAGAQGSQGTVGAQGSQGAAGAQGSQGAAGAQGSQGAAGAQGNQGTTGIQGSPGAQGSNGLQGLQGNPGPSGPQGIPGNVGYSGSLTGGCGGGWTQLPNGLIMQWGRVNPTSSPQFIAWPITFPNGIFSITVTPHGDGKRSGVVASYSDAGYADPTTSGAYLGVGEGGHASWELFPFYWTAIGY